MKLKLQKHNQLLIKLLSASILIFSFCTVSGQLINSDQAPPSVKWMQITETDFNLIYPIELYKEAQRTANILKNTVQAISQDLGIKPRKINIILQNRNTEGNGYVQLAPRKSEFYTTPPQASDPSDWIQTLAIHEYRHVVQIDKLTGKIKFPFEELGFAFFGFALPPWFYEGDAVLTETLLSKGGRGRIPSWEMELRANLLEGKTYSYQKNYLGSYKDVTPGYYELGYFLTTKIHRDYGDSILNNLFTQIASNPIRPYNFTRSLKKLTGLSTKQLHNRTLSELKDIWQKQRDELQPTEYTKVPYNKSKFSIQISHPQLTEKGTLLALLESPLRVSSIGTIDTNGNFNELVKTGRQSTPHFSYAAGKLIWDEVQTDGRFKIRNYSVIHSYDIAAKKHIQLTKKSRLFGPDFNDDGSKIAVVEINLSNENFLVILDAEKGDEILRIPSPENKMLSSVSFEEGDKVLAVTRTPEGSGIIEFSLADKSSTLLIDKQIQELESPSYVNDDILFKANYNGIDNIYLLNPQTSAIKQVTNVKYGAFDPFFDPTTSQLFFSNYNGRDFLICKTQFDLKGNKPINEIPNTFTSYFKPLQSSTDHKAAQDTVRQEIFPQKAYKEFNHLLNFHSLSINNGDYDDLGNYKPGLFALSNNLMNTLAAKVGITYDLDQHGLNFLTEIQYNRYFPKFIIGYENRALLSNIRHPKDSVLHAVRWREHSTQFQVSLPYSFNRLNQNYSFNLRVASSYIQRYNMNNSAFEKLFINRVQFPLTYQLSVGKNNRYSSLDLAPRWGQNVVLGFRHLPFSELDGSRYFIQSTFYFPGIMRSHSSQLRFNLQQRDGFFKNENTIPMVSGYDQLRLTQPDNTFFINYKFPFAYPDFEIGSLAYIKRLKANFFSDFEDIGVKNNFKPRTFGIEIRADMNLFRFLLPNFDLGIKSIYINENNPKRFIFQYSMGYSY